MVTCPKSQQSGSGPALAGFCVLAELTSTDGGWWRYGDTKARGREILLRCPQGGARPPACLPDELVPSLLKVGQDMVQEKGLCWDQAALPTSRLAARPLCQPLFPVSQPSRGAVQDIVSRERAKWPPFTASP